MAWWGRSTETWQGAVVIQTKLTNVTVFSMFVYHTVKQKKEKRERAGGRKVKVPIISPQQNIYHLSRPSCKSPQGPAPKLPRTEPRNK